MPVISVAIPDTRPLFRPLCGDIVGVLRSVAASDWEHPTLAPGWRVRDVVAHLLDTALRRLSYHRDHMTPAPPDRPFASDRDLVVFINELNAAWIRAAGRLSPRVLVDLYAAASTQLCDFIEALPDDAPAMFPVSWAGERASSGLFDIGREFTEVWHHGAQVREAVGAGSFREPRWLHAVLAIAMQAVPHAYRDVRAPSGAALLIEITGASGGVWTLNRRPSGWELSTAVSPNPTARVTMADDFAWRLLFNAVRDPGEGVRLGGDVGLARPLLQVRSVIV